MNYAWEPAPIDRSWIRAGEPQAMIHPIANDGCVSTGYWQCTKGEFLWHYAVDETIVFVNGCAMIDGRIFTAGGTRQFACGSKAHWVVLEPVTKLYVIKKPKSALRRILGAIKRRICG